MKRKLDAAPAFDETSKVEGGVTDDAAREEDDRGRQTVFLLEDGRLKPISPEEYTTSTLYEVVESFGVECRLVRPEDPGSLVYEGKKPSRKTVPIVIKRGGDCVLLGSWESLEAGPEQLADAVEVVGAIPSKQVFVLRRK